MFVRLKVEVLVPDGPEQELRDCEIDEEGSGIVVGSGLTSSVATSGGFDIYSFTQGTGTVTIG